MKLPFVSRSRHEAALAEIKGLRCRVVATEERHDEAEDKRRRLARMLADADATNRRLNGRLLELGQQISKLTEADPEYAAALERRVARLRTVGKRILAAYATEKKRADHLETDSETGRLKRRVAHLQKQLDDAVGLPPGRIEDSRPWQPGYKKPKADAS